MIRLAYINFWKDPTNDSYFTHFISENLGQVQVVDPGDNPDILIASCIGDINNVRTTDAKYKLFFYGENLERYPPYNNDELLREVFNSIIGFRNTNGHIRFPLWLMYYPFYKYDKNANILKYIQSRYDANIRKQKTMFATHVARHDRGGIRAQLCDAVSAHGPVIYPGEFRNNVRPIGKTTEDKIKFISQSIFNICPENSIAEGYCTEKIFQALEAGTMPVYWGVDLPERGLINEDKYCFGPDLHYPNDGPVFTGDGPKIIESYYVRLKEEIYSNLYNGDA
jgi:alpha(1,3/1,4) fucosyltransferase